MEKELYKRILQHRPKELKVNMIPGAQSKMPDYYGEKIESVQGFRKWIREQKLFIARVKSGRLGSDDL